MLLAIAPAPAAVPPVSGCGAEGPELVQGFEERILHVQRHELDAGQVLVVLVDSQCRVWLPREYVDDMGIAATHQPSQPSGGTDYVALDPIEHLHYRYDHGAQALLLQVAPQALRRRRITLHQTPAAGLLHPPGYGAFVNVEAASTRASDGWTWGVAGDLGVFAPAGRATSTGVLTQDRFLRLETYLERDDPGGLRQLRLGDAVSSGGAWGRPVRYAGLQWRTDFSLQPYLVTYPLPGVAASAALPSSVDVFVNDALRGRTDVPPGPFEITEVPSVTGRGELVVVVRDALGRETRTQVPFYADPRLLRRGLTEWSYDLGVLRQDFGVGSGEYADFVTVGQLRRGWTDHLTQEVRVEASHRTTAAGSALTVLWPSLGVVSLVAAAGGGDDRYGMHVAAGFDHDHFGLFGFGIRAEHFSDGFRQVGDPATGSRRRLLARGSARLGPGRWLSSAFVYTTPEQGAPFRSALVTYRHLVNRQLSLELSYLHLTGAVSDRRAALGLSWSPGRGRHAALRHETHDSGQSSRVSYGESSISAYGHAWQVGAESGDVDRYQGTATTIGERGRANIAFDRRDRDDAWRLGAASALVWTPGHWFWSRHVGDAFAVVDVGAPGVRVYANRQLSAVTDASGTALLPGLRAYEQQRIEVADQDLPMDFQMLYAHVDMAVGRRQGTTVRFPAAAVSTRMIRVIGPDGASLPPGWHAYDADSGEEFAVGSRGRILISDSARRLLLLRDGRRCVVLLHHEPDHSGAYRCEA